ncbi:MAG TPA: tyrosine--tRNA ligase [Vicinamibacterales bacterium]|nr:tyrosine--tRNA ligase [Vicinamibacterales bacterium]
MTTLWEELQWRGLVSEATEGLADAFAKERVTAYIGFDPTASSLHVGTLLTIMGLARLQRFGHSPIAIVGGGTGMIGDPSGKTVERQLLTREQIDENVAGIRAQLARFLDFDAPANPARIVNNADWLASFDLLGFLRDTGKYFTVNYMLQKESVDRRLQSEEGISYTEFSYLLLQARDFLELFDRFHCTLQMGGTDQWGNITAGIDLIRKLRGKKAHGLVWPLLTTSSGQKFGKTEAGTIWLDPKRTSPFAFYQFWLNTDDRDVVAYLKYFTFLDRDAIGALEAATRTSPEKREAQRVLARELTRLVHGAEETENAVRASEQLFSRTRGVWDVPVEELMASLQDAPSTSVTRQDLEAGHPLTKWLTDTGLASSRSEATRLIRSGGIYVNNVPVTDEKRQLTTADVWKRALIVLAKGKKSKHVLKVDATD